MDKGIATASVTVIEPKIPDPMVDGALNSKSLPLGHVKPDGAEEDVRVVPIHEFSEAALALAEAFEHDEVARYFVDTPDRADWTEQQKWELHLQILEYITYGHCLKGLVMTVGPNFGCVALWMPPGKNMDDFVTIFRSGLWRLHYKLSTEGKKRFFNEFLPLLHSSKLAVLGDRDDESWYLVYIGCRPTARRKGYARKLIEYVTDIADRDGQACYLESSNNVNPKIYAKMGFEVRKKIYLQRAQEHIELDLMIREPKDPSSEKTLGKSG